MASFLRRAFESEEAPIAIKEDEMVFYVRIKDLGELQKAKSMESHEQYEINQEKVDENISAGRVRVRKTTTNNSNVNYTITSKTPASGVTDNASVEANAPANEIMFTQFKMMAPRGMVKDRFIFPIDEKHEWHVDAFPSANGAYHEWLKIDLEINGAFDIPDFPFEVVEAIITQKDSFSDVEKEKIDTLYKTVFTVPNPYKK